MTAAEGAAFWIDYDYDRENASDGVSRYGAYVRRSSAMAESWDGTWDDAQVRLARFAETAWATATTPVMSPGFVRRHPRAISAVVQFNAWDATLAGAVQLVTQWPHPLASSRDWQRDVWWQDWPAMVIKILCTPFRALRMCCNVTALLFLPRRSSPKTWPR